MEYWLPVVFAGLIALAIRIRERQPLDKLVLHCGPAGLRPDDSEV